jgi:hypothetical protein
MSRAALALALLCAPLAFAQGEEDPPPAPAPARPTRPAARPQPARVAEPPALPPDFGDFEGSELDTTPPRKPPTPLELAEDTAREFFLRLLAGDARTIVKNSLLPFALEDRRVTDRDELMQEWLRHLRSKRLDLHVLYGVEVFTPEEMEKKYGRPPARLQNLPWKAPKTWIAVANLSGRPSVAIFREMRPGELLLTGYHD